MLRIDINLVFTILNILIWAFIIKRFLFRPVERILEERRQAIEGERSAAEQEKQAANELKMQYESALSGADTERAQILRKAHDDGKKEYNQIVNDASKQAEQVIENAKMRAEEERRRILQSAGSSLSDLIAEAAAKVSGNGTQAEKDGALYDAFLGKAGTESETERK